MGRRSSHYRKSSLLFNLRFYSISISLVVCLLYGCAAPTRHPVPKGMVTQVRPLQLDSIRTFIDPWQPT